MAKSTRGVRPGRKHPHVVVVPAGLQRLRRHDVAPELSRDARRRLAMLDWHRAHGGNVARTARHFGYSRPTVYRWLARFERARLESLEDRSSRPRRRRRPTWTLAERCGPCARSASAIRAAGKDKLAVLLRRDGTVLSASHGGAHPRAPAPERRAARAGRVGASACDSGAGPAPTRSVVRRAT